MYSVLLAATALALSYLIAKAMYMLFFHPLAKYPGPLISKFTFARASYYAWRGDIHLDIWKCHKRYGPYVRYGPNQLMINTAQGVKDIYGSRASSKFLKSKHYEVLVHQSVNTFTHRGGKDHLRRRRIMAQGVSDSAQRTYEPRLASHVEKFCDVLIPRDQKEITDSAVTPDAAATNPTVLTTTTNDDKQSGSWSQPQDMAKWCNYLSFDMMADIVFGARYNLLGEERFRYVVEMIEKSNVRIAALVQWPGLSWMRLDKHLFKEAIFARNRFVKFVRRVVHDRMELSKGNICGIYEKTNSEEAPETKLSDLYTNLEAARDPQTGLGFRTEELAAESTTLIVAGSDTTACALNAVLFYLSDNEDAYNRAANEVRSKFAGRTHINSNEQGQVPFLRACIDEAMRMTPPVGTALVREVPREGAKIDGQTIPYGCEVGVAMYTIHHNTKVYEEPFKYKPERWLAQDDSINDMRTCFIPFSSGLRNCLGKGLAYTEMTLTLCSLLLQCDFKFADGELGRTGRGSRSLGYGRHRENEYQMYDHLVGQKNGPFLQFRRRDQIEA